jgi:type I restriction enzyme S subunit
MIADLKPYPEYRTAEGNWLGQVPSHWSVRRFKYLLRETDSRSTSGKEQLLRVSQYTGVTQRRRADGGDEPDTRAESLVGYKRVETSQLVVNIMLAWNGSLGVSNYAGIASPAYCVYHFNDEAHPWYYHHLLRSPVYKTRIKTLSTGVVESRLRLYTDSFYGIEGLLPPPSEQAAIVRFLDWANGRLERAIRAKRKVIALLHEQKQAIIHKAVTQGLDPNVPKRDSGIPWLGEIPSHWEVRRVKDEFRCMNTKRVPLNAVERGAMTSRIYDYYGASGPIDKVDDYIFDDELLLIAEDGANLVLRNLPLAIIARGKFWVNNHAHILKPKGGNLIYLAHFLETLNYRPWISGAAQPKLTQDRLMSISIAVAPLEEQDTIVQKVSELTQPISIAISRLEREITLLREYRTRLVADVVTGKLDVREVALSLPEEDVTLPADDLAEEAEEPELEEAEG